MNGPELFTRENGYPRQRPGKRITPDRDELLVILRNHSPPIRELAFDQFGHQFNLSLFIIDESKAGLIRRDFDHDRLFAVGQ